MGRKNIKNAVTTAITTTFIVILFLLVFTWIVFDFQKSSNSLKDTWTIVSSFFGGIATLTAAYIASLLFNDWRDEKNYDLKNQHLSSIVLGLRDIHAELLEMHSSSMKIKEAYYYLISYSTYVHRQRLDIQSTINKLKADITIYSMLMDNTDLSDLLDELQKSCKTFDDQYNQLIHKYYRAYLDELYSYFDTKTKNIPDIKEKSSFERVYVQNEKSILAEQRKDILIFFKLKPMDAYATNAINSHERLEQACIKMLRP